MEDMQLCNHELSVMNSFIRVKKDDGMLELALYIIIYAAVIQEQHDTKGSIL